MSEIQKKILNPCKKRITIKKRLSLEKKKTRALKFQLNRHLKLFTYVKYFRKELMNFLENHILTDICPVEQEAFSELLLPYKLNGCSHHLSLEAFSKLKIWRFNEKVEGTAFQICPLCRKEIHFAMLNVQYLQLITLKKAIETLSCQFLDLKTTAPPIIEPHGGVLTLLKKLWRKS